MPECECCGQTLPDPGVDGFKLTPVKKRIYLAVKRAGSEGIRSDLLLERVYAERPESVHCHTLKVHICQLNKTLRPASIMVRADKGGNHVPRTYRLRSI